MKFEVDGAQIVIEPEILIVAGFTGRDEGQVAKHVAELSAEGIPIPAKTPSFYEVSPELAIQGTVITVTHPETSGEAEIALLVQGGEVYVTLASDHTDRRVETLDIGISKRVCPKIFSATAWKLNDLRHNWDAIQIRSWILEAGQRVLYQSGTAAELLGPDDLLARVPFRERPEQFALLGGTLPTIGGIRGSKEFWSELTDPASGKTIHLAYSTRTRRSLRGER